MAGRDKVLVMHGDSAIGLAVIRSLGRHGVETHTSISDPKGLGQYSRYASRVLPLLDSRRNRAEIAAGYCREHGITHLMAISENTIGLLNRHREWFEPRTTLLFPPQPVFERALYKDQTMAIAARCGIRVPRTVLPRNAAEIEAGNGLRYPVILKPRHRDTTLGVQAVFSLKAEKAPDHASMVKILRQYEGTGELPMVQEYIEGTGAGVSILMRGGEAVAVIQHRRLREYPVDGGVSVYCECMPEDADLVKRSIALLRAMEWEGVAMVEYRTGEPGGEPCLMEVNGRFWGSLPLALHAGADFPYLLYRSLSERVAQPRPRAGTRARSLAGDTKWLLETLRRKNESKAAALWSYVRAFSPSNRYFIWAADDPRPAVMNFLNRFWRALPEQPQDTAQREDGSSDKCEEHQSGSLHHHPLQ
jgi:predicted ATP-grasp superfamily ATP-dependent carboligase